MKISVLLVSLLVLFSGCFLSPASAEQQKVKPVSSKIQYVSGEEDLSGTNNVYGGSSPDINRYDSFPNSYDGFLSAREILRNRFRGSDSSSKDESGDGSYSNDRGSSTGNGQDEMTNRSFYPGEEDETPNGVFSDPFQGQNRRILNLLPPLFSSIGNSANGAFPSLFGNSGNGAQPNLFSAFGNNGNGAQPVYGTQYPPVGAYDPNFRLQPGIFPPLNGFRPGVDPGYMYPSGGGSGGNGLGQRQPIGAYGPSYGNGYGAYPGTFRNNQPRYPSSDGMNGGYRGSRPRTYGPPPFGNDRYPEPVFPGQGYEYGKYKDSKSNRDKFDEGVGGRKGSSPYSHSSSSYSSSKKERSKDYDRHREKDYDGHSGREYDGPHRERDYP